MSSQPFQNTTRSKYIIKPHLKLTVLFCFLAISVVNSFHPSAQQKSAAYMNVELDVEKRLQAAVAKDRIRIREFFIDFDKLRKGTVGEAAVSNLSNQNIFISILKLILTVFLRYFSSEPALVPSTLDSLKLKFSNCWLSTSRPTALFATVTSAATSTQCSLIQSIQPLSSRTPSPPLTLLRVRRKLSLASSVPSELKLLSKEF